MHDHEQSTAPARGAVAYGPCPYCGHVQRMAKECVACRGLFEPLSRQVTQDAMGPWQVRDESNPFLPGCSYNTLRALIARGRVTADHVVRGPTTRQFWAFARDTPGVAHLLGECHSCHAPASATDRVCKVCRASFAAPSDRASLGIDLSATDRNGAHVATHTAHAAPPHIALPFERVASSAGAKGPASPRLRRTNVLVLVTLVALCAAFGAWFGRDFFDADRVAQSDAPANPPSDLGAVGSTSASSDTAGAPGAEPKPDGDGVARGGGAFFRDEAETRKIVEGLDENDLNAVRAAVQTLRGLRDQAAAYGSNALLDAEIERLERRIDELILRKFL